MKKLWYAVMTDLEDNDWGTGSFDVDEARAKLAKIREYSPEAYIAVIDGGYDVDGNATVDPICVEEIHE